LGQLKGESIVLAKENTLKEKISVYKQGNALQIKQKFKCDGRVYGSQKNSYAETLYFIRYYPNIKMDGDQDGLPYENDSRWQ